jgi:antitoxin component of MazEF toxin-antitoxin module
MEFFMFFSTDSTAVLWKPEVLHVILTSLDLVLGHSVYVDLQGEDNLPIYRTTRPTHARLQHYLKIQDYYHLYQRFWQHSNSEII